MRNTKSSTSLSLHKSKSSKTWSPSSALGKNSNARRWSKSTKTKRKKKTKSSKTFRSNSRIWLNKIRRRGRRLKTRLGTKLILSKRKIRKTFERSSTLAWSPSKSLQRYKVTIRLQQMLNKSLRAKSLQGMSHWKNWSLKAKTSRHKLLSSRKS
jgi:hypothetical protein